MLSMLTIVFVSNVFIDWGVGNTPQNTFFQTLFRSCPSSHRKLIRSKVKRSIENGHNLSEEVRVYFTDRNITSVIQNGKRKWFVVHNKDREIESGKEVVRDHQMNPYNDQLDLIAGIPFFVGTVDNSWYKIMDSTTEFREYLFKCQFDDDIFPLEPEDFKPAKVTLANGWARLCSSGNGAANETVGMGDGSLPDNFHKHNASDLGYFTGYTVIGHDVNGTRIQEFLVSVDGTLKKIVSEHMLNVYITKGVGLAPGVPVFVQTEDKLWYKILDPSAPFRKFISSEVRICTDDNESPFLGVEDYKPARVKYMGEILVTA